MEYKKANKRQVLSDFRRSQGVADKKEVGKQQAISFALTALTNELVYNQYLKMNALDIFDPGQSEPFIKEAETKMKESQILASNLLSVTGADPSEAMQAALDERLEALEVEHIALEEIRENPGSYPQRQQDINIEIKTVECAIEAVTDYQLELDKNNGVTRGQVS